MRLIFIGRFRLGTSHSSHIRAWAADAANRLNPRNGLRLNALHDRAFDRGLMWVEEGFVIRFAKRWRSESQMVDGTLAGYTMKIPLKAITCALFVLATCSIGFWVTAQSHPRELGTGAATNDSYALEELASFSAYLEKAKLTNVADRFNAFEDASLVTKESAEIGIMTHLLVDLRKGRTNDAIELLELQLEVNAIGLAASYQELPDRIREKVSLLPLTEVQYYYTNYGFSRNDPQFLDGITNALKLINEPKKK